MQVIVQDLVVAYEKSGTGPIVVMLHGWADNLHTFDALATMLEQYYTVVRIDLPGFGNSQAPRTNWSLNDYAVAVAQALQKIAIMPNSITMLIGHSNGGSIAIKAIATQVLKPKKLVLLASAGIRQGSAKKTAYKMLAKTGKAATIVMPAAYKLRLRRVLYGSIGSDLLIAKELQGTFKKVVAEDMQAAAEKVTIPTCILYGELDTQTPPLYGHIYHRAIQDSKLHIIQNADHFLHQTYTNAVFNYICKFDKS